MSDILYIVVPCFNEEEVLPETSRRLDEKLNHLKNMGMVAQSSKVLYVDDGSSDSTWLIIEKLCNNNPANFSGLKLSRNRGHQNALFAGLMQIKEIASVTISMDADLQDDINAIDKMILEYHKGFDVVYGVRSDRDTDSKFKRSTAQGFYKFMSFLGVEIVYNHADYRLLSRKAIDGLADFPEVNLFLRGMVPLVGYPSTTVSYSRGKRYAGESKYSLRKMLNFAWDGITSFSIQPIRIITLLGGGMLAFSLIVFIALLLGKLFGKPAQGWSSLFFMHWVLASLQIFCLGIVGEYVGKIYMESKKRPRYIVEKYINKEN